MIESDENRPGIHRGKHVYNYMQLKSYVSNMSNFHASRCAQEAGDFPNISPSRW